MTALDAFRLFVLIAPVVILVYGLVTPDDDASGYGA